MSYKIFWFLVSALFVVFLCTSYTSCNTQQDDGFFGNIESNDMNILPSNAKNINDLGNGWVSFDLDVKGSMRTFMFYRAFDGYSGYVAITEIK